MKEDDCYAALVRHVMERREAERSENPPEDVDELIIFGRRYRFVEDVLR